MSLSAVSICVFSLFALTRVALEVGTDTHLVQKSQLVNTQWEVRRSEQRQVREFIEQTARDMENRPPPVAAPQ